MFFLVLVVNLVIIVIGGLVVKYLPGDPVRAEGESINWNWSVRDIVLVAVLAVLKVGAAYVAIDPVYPLQCNKPLPTSPQYVHGITET